MLKPLSMETKETTGLKVCHGSVVGSWTHIALLGASKETFQEKLLHLFLFHSDQSHFHQGKTRRKQQLPLNKPSRIPSSITTRAASSLPHNLWSSPSSHVETCAGLSNGQSGLHHHHSGNYQARLDCIFVYDIMQPWLPSISSALCIPAVHFQLFGVAALSFAYRLCRHQEVANPFPEIFFRESEIIRKKEAPHSDANPVLIGVDGSSDIILVKSCDEMEGKYMDFLSDLSKKKVVSVGPLLVHDSIYDDKEEQSEVLQWLSNKEESSTVFVSFGTEIFLTKDEMEEVAHGLEDSNVNFIWVLRLPSGETNTIKQVEEILPEGFVERAKERGKIVEGWAPQARILKHRSIGGFVSHCGWSSVTESLSCGVPIIAMPMQYEQPLNARMVEDFGVGMEVLRDENGVVKREEVAKVIREVVVEESGEDVRKKARELGEKIRAKGNEDIDRLVEELQKLCNKYNENKVE